MPKIFISYRRHDSAEVTKRLHGRLANEFDAFYDIDSIPPGVDFRKRLSGAVEQSDVLLAVIGGSWLNATFREGPKQGQRRLDDPDDYVRIEIESALTLGVPVIPVLLDGTTMPGEADLPGEMKELAYRNAAEVRFGPEFNVHVDRLIDSLRNLVKDQQELWDGLDRARDIAGKDSESGVNCARKVLERVLREVYERRIKEPAGTRPLAKIAERLVDDWYLPNELGIDALLSTTGLRGKTVTTNDAQRALTQLTEILKWYTEVERPDGLGQLPFRRRLSEINTSKAADNSPAPSIAIVPKGLRSFDAKDSKFFLELLPGPRDEEGLPESIQFWKQRIEPQDELTFTVGLIYGPSGCGKSSLMKAGLLPRLADHVLPVYVEATADGTETRLLRGLRERCPELPNDIDLSSTIAALRQGQGLAESEKVFVVLDQFEQWLHAKHHDEDTELVKGLRQCDGKRVQAVVMVRDDFWMAVTRFLAELEVDLFQGRNLAAVDLFDLQHAKRVLEAFGRAHGALPQNATDKTADQQRFLDLALSGLSEDRKVICVRLAVFAEMMKAKPWTTAMLKEVGGTEGVGVTFLEETFSAPSANPSHRLHQKAARAVLKVLLPEQGSDIKGNMRSRQELMEASGYGDRPKNFDALIRILDNEVRLITPTDPEGVESDASNSKVEAGQKYFQLTHDYLVPPLREWLTRKQKETRRGRAELRMADRAALWKEKRENRYLPSLWESLNIRLLTEQMRWTEPQRKMMNRAGRFHATRCGIAVAVLVALTVFGVAFSRKIEENRRADYAAALVKRIVAADITEVPGIVQEIDGYRRWADPFLRQEDAQAPQGSNKKLYLDLALLPVDRSKVVELRDELLFVPPSPFLVVRDALLPYKEEVAEPLWKVAHDSKRNAQQQFQAACALATFAPDDQRWSQINEFVAGRLVTLETSALVAWRETLRPAKRQLIQPLAMIFRDTNQEKLARSFATDTLADYAADQPKELFDLLTDAEQFQFPVIFDKLAAQKEMAVALATEELAKKPPAKATEDQKEFLAKRQANAAVALLRLGSTDQVWPTLKFSPDPRVRSYIIHWLSPLGAEPQAIVQRLDTEPDVTIRRALILAVGEFTESQLSMAQRQPLIEKLLGIYESEPDAGLHGAAEWLLRKWRQEKRLETVLAKLTTDDKPLQAHKPDKRHWYVNTQKQTFVIVDGSEFLMGSLQSEPGRDPYEGEVPHRVHIGRRFAISGQEVTKAQYRSFQQAVKGFDLANYPQLRQFVPTNDSPQTAMTWYEAAHYCDWLSEQEKISREQWCYDPKGAAYGPGMKAKEKFWELAGYRLPTEAEWEFACRAGTVTSRYYGLSEQLLPQYAWFLTNSKNHAQDTATLEPNDWGLFDMLGNALEWCFDPFGEYPEQKDKVFEDRPLTQPVAATDIRVLRSGAFFYPPSKVRCAFRTGLQAVNGNTSLGFRPARSMP